MVSQKSESLIVEARVGFEPTNKGFADPPLNHLGIAPGEAHYTISQAQQTSLKALKLGPN